MNCIAMILKHHSRQRGTLAIEKINGKKKGVYGCFGRPGFSSHLGFQVLTTGLSDVFDEGFARLSLLV